MIKALNINILAYIIIAIFVMITQISAQNSFSSSEQLQENAEKYFENDEYIMAFPLYSQLLSLNREDPVLQYRFGVCLLYSDRSDTYAPIKYLKKALNHVSTPDIYYHLGFAHHINYDFPTAISYYKEYQQRAGKKQKESFDVDRKIEMCRNGIDMMRSVKDLFVLDKSEVARQEFFRSYNLENYGGKIIKKPEKFRSKEDEKSKTDDFIFFNSKASSVYYSGYGKNHKNQRDIYVRYKSEDDWSSPIRLPEVINSPYDEDYPVLMPDGKTLYFSSKGHNTIGGYDIFKSVYDEQSKTWSLPENINFPFNTPTDDILFVPDTLESTAWFASVRNSVEESIMVYRVGIIKRPGGSEDLAAIYAKNKQLTEDDLRKIKDRARLDVNISEEEFEDEPDSDLITQAEKEHKENLQKIALGIDKKEQEQAIIDSAKFLVNRLEKNIDSFDSLRQKAKSIAASKRLESKRMRETIKANLALTASTSNVDNIQKLIEIANNDMMLAEKLDYEASELDAFARDIKIKIDTQRETFTDVNTRYGDAEQAVINGNPDRALAIIGGMNTLIDKIPQPSEINAPIGNNEAEIDIHYPAKFKDGSFQAFALNSQGDNPQVESYDVRYDEYIPTIESKQITLNNSEYSNNPSARLQEYINTLSDSKNSIDIQISELNNDIEEIKKNIEYLSNDEKQKKLALLNQLEEEKSNFQSRGDWMYSQINDKQDRLQILRLSSADIKQKIESYQAMNEALENVFNFNKKIFKEDAAIPKTTSATIFTLSADGKLIEQRPNLQLKPSSEIEFTNKNKDLIEKQATQILAEARQLRKENQFLIKKIDHKLNQLEVQANEAFNDANQLLQSARRANSGNKLSILDQANVKFNDAAFFNSIYLNYQEKKNEISKTIDNQEAIINKLNSEYDELNAGIQNEDYASVESNYKRLENTYQNNKVMSDFSSEIDYEKGELISVEENDFNEDVFELNASGEIVKTIGDVDNDWNSFESFSSEMASSAQSSLVLSPNTNLQARQTQFTDIFEPQQAERVTSLQHIDLQIPAKLSSSDNSLVENTIDQINSLKSKLNEFISKRNIVNQYYKNQLTKSSVKENNSLALLDNSKITGEILNNANQLAQESKEELYKASVAASLIRQYDEQISTYSFLISNAFQTASEVEELVSNGDQDEALLKNVQLQRKISNIDSQKIKNSHFDFAANKILLEIPTELNSAEIQEFTIVDGKIQRNKHSELNQLFYKESYPVKVDAFDKIDKLVSSESFVSASDITDNNTQSELSQNKNNENNFQDQSLDNNREFDSNENPTKSTDVVVSLKSYNPNSFTKVEDYRQALSELNSYGQEHLNSLNAKSASLAALAEQKLNKSNDLNIQSENATADSKQILKDSARVYLYEALAIKEVAESLDNFILKERNKQDQITQATFEMEQKLKNDNILAARQGFQKLKEEFIDFESNSADKLTEISKQMIGEIEDVNRQMDSAYNYSQELANESVKLLSEAKEERENADGKRNAFKRREYLKQAEEKELRATRLQNDSEKALATGNQLYQRKIILAALSAVNSEIDKIAVKPVTSQRFVNNQEVVYENLDSRKTELFDGHLNTTKNIESQNQRTNNRLAETDDIHVYQRENFKAEMISEELDLLKREIALLVQTKNQSLSEKENYVVSKKIDLLRQKADSLEYEANKAFEFASKVLESLSDNDQKKAQEAGRDFGSYLTKLKGKIEFLLSEAASLKQRAQRSNNIETREDLFNQAKEKEEVAMYLILEEFEVIAQKNITRYRRNQLILEQLLMENASPEERELMRNIFVQIDNYFSEAAQKREKANQPGTSFSMKKILLQDAYSLEMKGLDLQQKAKSMIEDNNRISMLAYQEDNETVVPSQEDVPQEGRSNVTENQLADNETDVTVAKQKEANTLIRIPMDEEAEEGIYYKVQFTALKEIKNNNDFPGISEITAERVSGKDFIRYFSGKFDNIDNAIIRRNSIRASGYSDAFIKSWRNGEEVDLLSLSSNQNNTASEPSTSLSTETSINNIDFSATNITSLRGVYYTVQVGVYSRPRTSAMIYGISPLYHKRMNNGYWVYYSGIFNSIAAAEGKKEEIRQKGVGDAFVVAFSNGDQINLAEARQQISRGEVTPSDDAIVILEDASIQLNRQWNLDKSSTTISQTDENSNKLIYKVQVGVYSNPINLNWISSQLDNNNPVERYQNNNEKYVFTVGNFKSEEEARQLLREVIKIIPDAFIVGFQNSQKKYIR